MDANLIFTVALDAAIIVVVLALVGSIIYYRWQLGDKNATLGRFIDENAELRRKMHRTGVAVALLCLTMTSTAQTNQPISWVHSDRFPELPHLKADFDVALSAHSQQTLLLASPASEQHRDSINEQSIMFRHTGNKATSHFQLNSRPRIQTTGDPMIGTRDRIVRKRRINEGHPLPPPTPVMRK